MSYSFCEFDCLGTEKKVLGGRGSFFCQCTFHFACSASYSIYSFGAAMESRRSARHEDMILDAVLSLATQLSKFPSSALLSLGAVPSALRIA